jgi:hypothetical protein
LGRQLRLPGFQQKQPTGGEVETGRGKKSKKTGWHLTLGIKETIFAGVGVAGLMMMSFALGALAGRGDIYRAASSWGLMSQEGPKVAQWTPPTGISGGPPTTAPAASAGSEATPAPIPPVATAAAPAVTPLPQAPATVPVPGSVPVAAAKPAHPAPVTASITPLSPPVPAASAKKKGKTGAAHHDPKAREEEMRRERQELAKKLNFQNSFDTAPKARLPKSKEHDKAQAKGAKSQPSQVRVGQYRNGKEAQAKVAELQKKGVKASLKTSKDAKGTLYIVYKPGSTAHTDTEKLAKKEKSSSATKKPAE